MDLTESGILILIKEEQALKREEQELRLTKLRQDYEEKTKPSKVEVSFKGFDIEEWGN